MEEDASSQASSNMEEDQQSDANATAKDHPATMDMIIKELRAFRKDTNEQFNAIRENVDGIGIRLDEAEGRIDVVET